MSGFYSEEYNRTFPDQPEGPEYAPYVNKGGGTKPSISKSTLVALVAAAAMTAALFSSDFDVDYIQTHSAIFEYEVKSEEGDIITYELITGGETVQEGLLDLGDNDLLFDDLTPDTRYSVKVFKNRKYLDTIHFRTKPLGGNPEPDYQNPVPTDVPAEPSSGSTTAPTAESLDETLDATAEAIIAETTGETTEETTLATTEETTEETTEPTAATWPKWPPYRPSKPKPRPTEGTDPTEESTDPTYESTEPTEESAAPTEESIATEPIVTEPVVTEPIVTEPISTDPVVTEPIVTEPISTQPISTEPIYTQPVFTQPVIDPGETPTFETLPYEPGTGASVDPPAHNAFSLRNLFSFLMTVIRL